MRQIVRETFASSSDMALKLELVDTLQRIGVSYRYGEEIDELLRAVHRDARQHQEDRRDDDDHLYVTSLRFYLLRNPQSLPPVANPQSLPQTNLAGSWPPTT